MAQFFKTPLLATSMMVASMLVSLSLPAAADQINGNWCSPKGQTLSIDGAHVITPAGNVVSANHDRHHIDYQIPAGEPNAGDRFTADQLSDEKISVKIVKGKPPVDGASEIWTACKPTV